jgi:hypothetical protein
VECAFLPRSGAGSPVRNSRQDNDAEEIPRRPLSASALLRLSRAKISLLDRLITPRDSPVSWDERRIKEKRKSKAASYYPRFLLRLLSLPSFSPTRAPSSVETNSPGHGELVPKTPCSCVSESWSGLVGGVNERARPFERTPSQDEAFQKLLHSKGDCLLHPRRKCDCEAVYTPVVRQCKSWGVLGRRFRDRSAAQSHPRASRSRSFRSASRGYRRISFEWDSLRGSESGTRSRASCAAPCGAQSSERPGAA